MRATRSRASVCIRQPTSWTAHGSPADVRPDGIEIAGWPVTLKHLLHRRGTGLTPTRALALLATLQSADIILPTTDGREIRLRRVTQPTPEQQLLLDQLDITIPTHLEWNAECSADFVTS